jgi:hypothetical protein
MYCSGDVWLGNTTRPYDDAAGNPVIQSGYYNARATLDWIIQQQEKGYIASTLSQLVVMGCSAGSIGAQMWGNKILTSLRWKTSAVVPDSYAGVFPEGTQGPLIYDFGACSVINQFASESLVEMCNAETLTLQDLMFELIGETPTVPYAYVQVCPVLTDNSKIKIIFIFLILILFNYVLVKSRCSPAIFLRGRWYNI